MYRKSMREALEEARQYTAIHEVKVSKGRQTLDIAKDDLPVYKAKGWKLALESAASDRAKSLGLDYMSFGRYGKDGKVTHKNIDGTLTAVDKDEKPIKEPEDKKDDDSKIPADIKKGYDEIKDYEITDNNAEAVEKLEAAGQAFEDAGNEDYAGDIQDALEELMDGNVREADDLLSDLKIKIKRAAGMDVSNESLEEKTITEFKRMTVRIRDKNKFNRAMKDLDRLSAKQNLGLAVLDKGMYKVIQVNGNDRDLNNIAKDLKNFYGAEIKAESVELEERFTIGDFKRLEADNRHDIAAKKLVDKFGTPEDKKEIDAINKRHNKTGYITGPDFKKRTQIVNKYFSKLMP